MRGEVRWCQKQAGDRIQQAEGKKISRLLKEKARQSEMASTTPLNAPSTAFSSKQLCGEAMRRADSALTITPRRKTAVVKK